MNKLWNAKANFPLYHGFWNYISMCLSLQKLALLTTPQKAKYELKLYQSSSWAMRDVFESFCFDLQGCRTSESALMNLSERQIVNILKLQFLNNRWIICWDLLSGYWSLVFKCFRPPVSVFSVRLSRINILPSSSESDWLARSSPLMSRVCNDPRSRSSVLCCYHRASSH